MKYILLSIALLMSGQAQSHEWEGKKKWVVMLMQDLNEVTRCYGYILEDELIVYKRSCWPKMIAMDHKKTMEMLQEARAHHPDMDIEQFLHAHYDANVADLLVRHVKNATYIDTTMVFVIIADGIVRYQE